MNFLTRSVLLLTLIFMYGPTALQAQCNLSAPANVWTNDISATSIEIEWDPVIGAVNYEVTTIIAASNTVINVEVVSGPTYTTSILSPETEYEFQVRAICANGTVSTPGASVFATTGVIVVDIVVQLTCPNYGTDPPKPYTPGTPAYYFFNSSPVIALEGDALAFGGIPYYLVVENGVNPQTNNPQFTIGTSTSLQSSINIVSNGSNAKVYYQDPANTQHLILTAWFYSGLNPRVKVKWEIEGEVLISKCDNVTFVGDDTGSGGGKGNGESEGGNDDEGDGNDDNGDNPGLVMAPNPTTGPMSIRVAKDTPILIMDSQGRPWYEGEATYGDRLRIDASSWPAGIYFLQTIENHTPKLQRFIKL